MEKMVCRRGWCGMRFNMYLYFQKEKPEGEDKPDEGKPRGRFIVRAVIMIALIYLCVREDEWIVGAGIGYKF